MFVRFWLTAGNIGTIHPYEPGQKRKSADYNHVWNCTLWSYWHCLAMRTRLSKSVSKGILNQQICVKLQNSTWNIKYHYLYVLDLVCLEIQFTDYMEYLPSSFYLFTPHRWPTLVNLKLGLNDNISNSIKNGWVRKTVSS